MDTFQTISSASQGVYREKGSKFIAFAYPVKTEDDVHEKLSFIRKKYFDARHHCYAYRLGSGGERFRESDDGEPSNSAGKPILGQLTAFDLSNVLVVVVRYFGGILLGVGGLIHAYKTATADALSNAQIIAQAITETYTITFDYADINNVMKIVKDMHLDCSEQNFDTVCEMKITVANSRVEQMKKRLHQIKSLKMVCATN
jgi:uncharacterized YigZ family protein